MVGESRRPGGSARRGWWARRRLSFVFLCTVVASSVGAHQGRRSAGIGTKRVRQHVNPLRSTHQQRLELPATWPETAFAQPRQPLHVDIGCARGYYVLDLAAAKPEWNVLGLEIRSVLVEAAQADVASLGLTNAAFVSCNANVNLQPLLHSLEAYSGRLHSASLQFPDPWFKTKHHKRRTLQPALVSTIADSLRPGGWFLVQTDVKSLAEQMRLLVRETEAQRLADMRSDLDDWDAPKPAEIDGLTTERERASEALGRPVYRCLFTRV